MRRVLYTVIGVFLLPGLIWLLGPAVLRGEGDMRHPRSEIHAASLGDDIYVAGGIGFFRTLSACETFDARGGSWSPCPALPRALHHVAMAAAQGRIYASGGYVSLPFVIDPKPGLFALTPGEDKWRKIADLPGPMGQHAMVAHQDALYLVGGEDDDQKALASLWRYDLASGDWTPMADMPTPRHSHAIAYDGSRLFVSGGRSARLGDSSDIVEAYDFDSNRWEALPAMPAPRGGHAAFVEGDALHVIGGEVIAEGAVLDSQDILDLATLQWRAGQPLTHARHGLAAAKADGRHWALGGGGLHGLHTIYSVTGTVFPVSVD